MDSSVFGVPFNVARQKHLEKFYILRHSIRILSRDLLLLQSAFSPSSFVVKEDLMSDILDSAGIHLQSVDFIIADIILIVRFHSTECQLIYCDRFQLCHSNHIWIVCTGYYNKLLVLCAVFFLYCLYIWWHSNQLLLPRMYFES